MGKGWMAPKMDKWLEDAVQEASMGAFNKPALVWGEGGSIPFMGMLGDMFPKTQFIITGACRAVGAVERRGRERETGRSGGFGGA